MNLPEYYGGMRATIDVEDFQYIKQPPLGPTIVGQEYKILNEGSQMAGKWYF